MLHQVVPATEALARAMAPRLRAADAAEVMALGSTAEEALLSSLQVTPGAKALLLRGLPCAIWGVQPLHLGMRLGVAWMLGTPELVERPLWFWRFCKAELAVSLQSWDVLVNWVDAQYDASLRWARRLGFTVDAPRPHGPHGSLFCAVAIRRR